MLASAKVISNVGHFVCPLALAPRLSPQFRLFFLVWLNVVVIAASVWIERWLFWDVPTSGLRTPRWWFALGQAAALGFILSTAVPDRRSAIVQAIFAGTIIGYVYDFVGTTVIAERLAVQRVDLVFQAVELGCVCCACMTIGAVTRFVGRWHAAPAKCVGLDAPVHAQYLVHAQYTVADLLFLMGIVGIVLGLFNLFLDGEFREVQLWQIGSTVALATAASLPWLWGVTQKRLKPSQALVIPLISSGLLLFLALREYALTVGEFPAILVHAGQRTAAITFAATLNGLALRGLGFAWRRG